MRFHHEGLIYESEQALTDVLTPVLLEAAEAQQPMLVALPPEQTELLRASLDGAADRVTFFDHDAWYARPGSAFVAWSNAVDAALETGASTVYAVGEPPLAREVGREGRWTRYESLFNQFYADLPVRLICPYDARTLSDEGLAVCRHTHPTLATSEGRTASAEYFAGHFRPTFAPLLDSGRAGASAATATAPAEVASLRAPIVWAASQLRLSVADAQDMALAVTELAQWALAAGSGPVKVWTAKQASGLVCEVALSGTSATNLTSGGGRLALAMGGIVADRVEFGDDENGGLVRFVVSLPKLGSRERILAAAQELFSRGGIRRTSVNAIATRANVAKATFYSLFPSKDELIRESIRCRIEQWDTFARAEVEERAESPRDRILAWFDVLAEWAELDVRAGSSLLRIWSEVHDPLHPGQEQQTESAEAVRNYLRDLASACAVDPEVLSQELQLLASGALLETIYLGSAKPIRVAGAAAAKLLASAPA